MYELSDAKKNKMKPKYDPDNLFLKTDNYDDLCFQNKEATDTTRESDKERLDGYDKEFLDISNMPPLEH